MLFIIWPNSYLAYTALPVCTHTFPCVSSWSFRKMLLQMEMTASLQIFRQNACLCVPPQHITSSTCVHLRNAYHLPMCTSTTYYLPVCTYTSYHLPVCTYTLYHLLVYTNTYHLPVCTSTTYHLPVCTYTWYHLLVCTNTYYLPEHTYTTYLPTCVYSWSLGKLLPKMRTTWRPASRFSDRMLSPP